MKPALLRRAGDPGWRPPPPLTSSPSRCHCHCDRYMSALRKNHKHKILHHGEQKENLELGTGWRLTGTTASAAVCPGIEVVKRRKPTEKNPKNMRFEIGLYKITIKTTNADTTFIISIIITMCKRHTGSFSLCNNTNEDSLKLDTSSRTYLVVPLHHQLSIKNMVLNNLADVQVRYEGLSSLTGRGDAPTFWLHEFGNPWWPGARFHHVHVWWQRACYTGEKNGLSATIKRTLEPQSKMLQLKIFSEQRPEFFEKPESLSYKEKGWARGWSTKSTFMAPKGTWIMWRCSLTCLTVAHFRLRLQNTIRSYSHFKPLIDSVKQTAKAKVPKLLQPVFLLWRIKTSNWNVLLSLIASRSMLGRLVKLKTSFTRWPSAQKYMFCHGDNKQGLPSRWPVLGSQTASWHLRKASSSLLLLLEPSESPAIFVTRAPPVFLGGLWVM